MLKKLTRRQRAIVARTTIVVFVALATFWTTWQLSGHNVPVVSKVAQKVTLLDEDGRAVLNKEGHPQSVYKFSVALPWATSRWLDLLTAPLMIWLFAVALNHPNLKGKGLAKAALSFALMIGMIAGIPLGFLNGAVASIMFLLLATVLHYGVAVPGHWVWNKGWSWVTGANVPDTVETKSVNMSGSLGETPAATK